MKFNFAKLFSRLLPTVIAIQLVLPVVFPQQALAYYEKCNNYAVHDNYGRYVNVHLVSCVNESWNGHQYVMRSYVRMYATGPVNISQCMQYNGTNACVAVFALHSSAQGWSWQTQIDWRYHLNNQNIYGGYFYPSYGAAYYTNALFEGAYNNQGGIWTDPNLTSPTFYAQ